MSAFPLLIKELFLQFSLFTFLFLGLKVRFVIVIVAYLKKLLVVLLKSLT